MAGDRRKSKGNAEFVETDMRIKKLIAQMAQCKGALTKTERILSEQPELSLDKESIQIRLRQLEANLQKYSDFAVELSVLTDRTSEEDFAADEFEEKSIEVICTLQKMLSAFTSAESQRSKAEASSSGGVVRLPEIDIPAFDGKDYAKYQTFLELFDAVIDSNQKLQPVQKLFYFRKYLKGEALSLIEGLPLTGDSYIRARELLKCRYDNKFLVVTNHVQALIDSPTIAKGTAHNLRELVSCSRQHLSALKAMGQPTEHWDLVVLTILLRKVDQFSCRAFHGERDNTKMPTIEDFFSFMEKRASSFEESQQSEGKSSFTFAQKNNRVSNIANIMTCKCCQSTSHKLFKCPVYGTKPVSERLQFVTKNNLCQICLGMHKGKCHFHFKCSICNSKVHNTLLHCDEKSDGTTCHANSDSNTVVLPTIKVKVFRQDGKSHIIARGLIDSGSQVSFITNNLANALNLTLDNNSRNISALGGQTKHSSKSANVKFQSLQSNYNCNVTCSVVDKITTQLPQLKIDKTKVIIPDSVVLADNDWFNPGNISFLLSADIFFKILMPTKTKLQGTNLYLVGTEFGSILSGDVPCTSASLDCNHVALHVSTHDSVDHLLKKFWEAEMVPEIKSEVISKQDSCEAEFRHSVQIIDSKFQVSLPLEQPIDQLNLGNTFAIAAKTLNCIEKRLAKDEQLYKRYNDFLFQFVELGHAKVLPLTSSNKNKFYFMQHLPVIKEDRRTTKLRVVFNGNTRAGKQYNSLNDVLLNGPTIQKDLFDILILFRAHKFVMVADIQHMYRAVLIDPKFHHLQNILWRNKEGELIVIQLQTVTYGLKSSSFLATRCLEELAARYGAEFPEAAEVIRSAMYVDDALFGANSIKDAIQVRNQFITLLSRAGFQLHKWAANDPQLLEDISKDKCYFNEQEPGMGTELKTLGILYDTTQDVFKIGSPTKQVLNWDKRSILSVIGSFFDPLGMAGPVIVRAKEFLQKVWKENLEWDSPIPLPLLKAWKLFYEHLIAMPTILIPRYINVAAESCAQGLQLIGYCDASSIAYGCCIYVRAIKDDRATTTLLCSKSRIAPIKNTLTMPRLELNGALLLARLYNKVKSIYVKMNFDAEYLFSDSQVVLCWLKSEKSNLPAYVKNRVTVINSLTTNCKWSHIDGHSNPADCLSRGCDPTELSNNTLWWHGPPQLADHKFQPFKYTTSICNHIACEREQSVELSVVSDEPDIRMFEKYSSWTKLQRVVAWILRFYYNCKTKVKAKSHLTIAEINNSKFKIISAIQKKCFAKEIECISNNIPIKSNLKSLTPFIDGNNVLRATGRLQNASIPYSQKYPILLPKKCFVTELIIRYEHLLTLHGTLKLTISSLSQLYWIVNCVREVSRVIGKCITCYRLRAQAASQLMGSLPFDRVNEAKVFSIVGIDYCGPFSLKQSSLRRSIVSKGYVCVFVCFSTKAIHLELISDMTTPTFIAALKRFISRRGLPTKIYCDNAKTFKGADNALKELFNLSSKEHQTSVINFSVSRGIDFNFIPSYSATFGGLWEASVKQAKHHFKRVIGNSLFTYEEFHTIMVMTEGLLNSRPITQMSRDPEDFSFLTPGHFLIGRAISSIPEPDITVIPQNRLRLWRRCEQIKQHFWNAWYKQYLNLLNNRPKWHSVQPNVKEGSLVLLRDERCSPLQWPVARVTKVYPGEDNKVRVVQIKMANGFVSSRAINKISVLPL